MAKYEAAPSGPEPYVIADHEPFTDAYVEIVRRRTERVCGVRLGEARHSHDRDANGRMIFIATFPVLEAA